MRPLLSLLLALLTLNSHGQIITTFAGKAPPPYVGVDGDGGLAVNAHLSGLYHSAVAFDAAGNMYLTEESSNTIRKVDVAGIITTIAGTGVIGYSGDGGPALNAMLYHPGAIIVDNAGNIIFGDQNDGILRKIDAAGIITTISAHYAGPCSGEGVPLSLAVFSGVYGLAKDNAGNIYTSDQDCNTVRKITPGGIVTTVAGNGSSGYSGDGGPATSAQLSYPGKVAVDNAGNIYIPDCQNHRIRKVNTSGVITTIGGNGISGSSGDGGPASSAEFAFPISIEMDNAGDIYVAEAYGAVVRKIDPAGIVTDYAGNQTFGYSGDGGPANQAQVTEIESISLDAAGNLYIVDYDNEVIRKVTNCVTATFSLQPASASSCDASPVTFQVNTANANSLQWQMNSGGGWVNLSDNSPYSGSGTNTLEINGVDPTMNNDQFRCVATNGCADTYSNSATLTVLPPVTASISISTVASTICSGTNASFQAAITNGGTSPIYQWQKNGIDAGVNSPTYSDPGIVNGDMITCLLTSNSTCITHSNVASNTITMAVNPVLSPSVSIAASYSDICAGSSVTFTANPVNEGNIPSYQWYRNGAAIGTNSASYTSTTLQNGDAISCTLTSSYGCLTSPDAASNSISVALSPNPVVTLDQNPNLCAGDSRILDAGKYSSFLWNNGSTDETLTITGPGTYSVTVTDDNGCHGNGSTTISTLIPSPTGFLPADTTICTYGSLQLTAKAGYINYLWSDNSSGASINITQPGVYWLEVTDNNHCTGRASIIVTQKNCLEGFFVPNAFTPNNDGKNDYFKPLLLGRVSQYQFTIFNRWGQKVFQTTNPAQGWDGSLNGEKQLSGSFVWICTYQFTGSPVVTKKGTVLLVR